MEIQGFKFDTEAEAQAAVDALNEHHGLPISPNATTRRFTDYNSEQDDFYYIYAIDGTEILGTPETITLNDSEI